MVDTLALLLLVVSLLLAPKDSREIALDAVDSSQGHVESLVATRTEQGFSVKAVAGNGAITIKRHPEKEGVYLVSMNAQDDPVEVDPREFLKQLAAATGDERSATVGETTVKAADRGDVHYVLAPGAPSLFVRRPTKVPERAVKGVIKVRRNTGVMSTDTYRLGDVVLMLEDGSTLTLVPSPTTSRDDLAKLDGKKVEVSGVDLAAAPPSAGEAAPLGADGKPTARAPRFEARSVKPLE